MNIHCAGLAYVIGAPHIVKQLVAGKGHAGVGQKQLQQREFLEGQRHPLACRRDGMAVQIQRHAAAGQLAALLDRGAAPQHRLHP